MLVERYAQRLHEVQVTAVRSMMPSCHMQQSCLELGNMPNEQALKNDELLIKVTDYGQTF